METPSHIRVTCLLQQAASRLQTVGHSMEPSRTETMPTMATMRMATTTPAQCGAATASTGLRFTPRFGDLPMEEAGVEQFSEYAALYARIAGQVGASLPARLDIQETMSISEQETRFVTDIVTPILGLMNSTKCHKLLRHVLDSIKEHGNLKLEKTAVNESLHNADKPFMTAPARTAVPSQPSS